MLMIANVVYKQRIGFFLHSFSSLQNNQQTSAQPLFTLVIPDFESLVSVAILAFRRSQFGFCNP